MEEMVERPIRPEMTIPLKINKQIMLHITRIHLPSKKSYYHLIKVLIVRRN